MAFNGIFLCAIKSELLSFIGARIDKIHQPSKDEVFITLRHKSTQAKLFISASPSAPRVHFSKINVENPKSPPMFCMLLRKHLGSAKISNVRQLDLDRVLFIDFETINELGDLTTITLVIEIMGKHSNIILVNESGKIIDSIKRVSEDTSSVRPILPGMTYVLPPSQNKLNILDLNDQSLIDSFNNAPSDDINKSIMQTFYGFSPNLVDEIVFFMLGGMPITKKQLVAVHYERFINIINQIKENILSTNANIYISYKENKPFSFSVIPIKQYGDYLKVNEMASASCAIDEFYIYREQNVRMKQRSNDLLKVVLNRIERITKKMAIWESELSNSQNRDTFKIYGDLINANLYSLEKGQEQAILDNFYDENYEKVTISLDVQLTPAQNAQKYYNEYRKAATAEKMLTELIKGAKDDIVYLDSTFDLITRTNSEAEIIDIKQELSEQGIIRYTRHKKDKSVKPTKPYRFTSSDGFTIICGKNNVQNDNITFKLAKNYDLWLHTQKIAGSHVVIVSDNKKIPNKTIEEAAIIAAYHSKARDSALVPVDYTLVRYVKKPNGAKPGMVIFTDYQTAFVTPNEELIKELLE